MNHSYFFVDYYPFMFSHTIIFSHQVFFGNVCKYVSFTGFGKDGICPGIVIDSVVMIMCKTAINTFLNEKS